MGIIQAIAIYNSNSLLNFHQFNLQSQLFAVSLDFVLVFGFVALYADFDGFFVPLHVIKLISQLCKTVFDHALQEELETMVRYLQMSSL